MQADIDELNKLLQEAFKELKGYGNYEKVFGIENITSDVS